MAHRFDSGLTRAQRRLIREAVIAQLGQLIVATKPESNLSGAAQDKFVVAVRALATPIKFGDTDLEDHLATVLQAGTPAICVALGDRRFDATSTDARRWQGELDVHVYAVSTHARGLVERLAGDNVADTNDAADPGLEVLLEHIFERLAGWPLTAQRATELRPTKEEFVYVGEDYTVAEILFTTRVQTDVNPHRDKTQKALDILSTHTDVTAGDPSDVVAETDLPAS